MKEVDRIVGNDNNQANNTTPDDVAINTDIPKTPTSGELLWLGLENFGQAAIKGGTEFVGAALGKAQELAHDVRGNYNKMRFDTLQASFFSHNNPADHFTPCLINIAKEDKPADLKHFDGKADDENSGKRKPFLREVVFSNGTNFPNGLKIHESDFTDADLVFFVVHSTDWNSKPLSGDKLKEHWASEDKSPNKNSGISRAFFHVGHILDRLDELNNKEENISAYEIDLVDRLSGTIAKVLAQNDTLKFAQHMDDNIKVTGQFKEFLNKSFKDKKSAFENRADVIASRLERNTLSTERAKEICANPQAVIDKLTEEQKGKIVAISQQEEGKIVFIKSAVNVAEETLLAEKEAVVVQQDTSKDKGKEERTAEDAIKEGMERERQVHIKAEEARKVEEIEQLNTIMQSKERLTSDQIKETIDSARAFKAEIGEVEFNKHLGKSAEVFKNREDVKEYATSLKAEQEGQAVATQQQSKSHVQRITKERKEKEPQEGEKVSDSKPAIRTKAAAVQEEKKTAGNGKFLGIF